MLQAGSCREGYLSPGIFAITPSSAGHRWSIFSRIAAASLMALSMKKSLPGLGLDESSASMILRADSKVAANRMACLRSSVMVGPRIVDFCQVEEGENSLSLLSIVKQALME